MVEQGVRVSEVSGRNNNFRIAVPGRPGFFLKHAPPEPGLDHPLAAEAAVYQWAGGAPETSALLPVLPRLLHYDPSPSILVLELLPFDGPDQSTADLLPGLAPWLAAIHRVTPRDGVLAALPRDPPWVFDLTRPSPASLRELAPAQLTLLQAIQADARVEPILAAMRRNWIDGSLIHGDFKGSNLAVTSRGPVLLDWELAQWGDPGWDLGGVFQAVISEDVLGLELPAQADPPQATESLGAMIARRRPDLAAFWDRYRDAAELGAEAAGGLRDRLASHTGLRLIKTAYEWCQSETRMPGRAAALLQLGLNMLQQPDAAGSIVLGVA